MNGAVNAMVNCVFHAPFTFPPEIGEIEMRLAQLLATDNYSPYY